MSTLRFRRAAFAVTAAAVLSIALAACSSDMDSKDKASDKSSTASGWHSVVVTVA
ncbi:hypothetical protein ACGFWI_08860 [Streptomyces sp. NPDC048434]|uniref:hypothetical protein n=1 Tax=Streptomyces sp. NPDC048434 TaxID=3365549 RepID=UPI003716FB1D